MRHSAALLSILAAAAAPAFGQDRDAEPTAFESFVSMPSVVVEFTQSIGTLRSTDATVEVIALVARDTAQPAERMQGVRLTLKNNTVVVHLYLDPGELAAAKSELAEIECGIAELKSGSDAPYRVQGTGPLATGTANADPLPQLSGRAGWHGARPRRSGWLGLFFPGTETLGTCCAARPGRSHTRSAPANALKAPTSARTVRDSICFQMAISIQ